MTHDAHRNIALPSLLLPLSFEGRDDAVTSRLDSCNTVCGSAAFNRRLVRISNTQPGQERKIPY